MNLTKKIARNILFPITIGVGLEKLFLRGNQNKILNIYYHGVVTKDSNYFTPRHLEINQFEKHLQYFKRNFDVISMEEAFLLKSEGRKVKKPTISISFDDGYKNNFDNALPLLVKYDIKATFFISGLCTENNDKSILWTDIIPFINFFNKNKVIEIDNQKFINDRNSDTGISLIQYLKKLDAEKRDSLIQQLSDNYNLDELLDKVDPEIWSLMNTNEIQICGDTDQIDIQSHGFNHYNLANINIKTATDDMLKSKIELEKIISSKVDMLCFPDGNYDDNVIIAAENMGYSKFVCCDYISKDHSQNKSIMDRYGVANTTTYESNMFFINRNFKEKGF